MSEPKEPSIPMSLVADWINEHARATNDEADQLQIATELLPAPDTCEGKARRERALGGLAARQKLLEDLKGRLIAQSADQAGKLDDIRGFENPIG